VISYARLWDRYGAFPSAKTWYLTAAYLGDPFPADDDIPDDDFADSTREVCELCAIIIIVIMIIIIIIIIIIVVVVVIIIILSPRGT
jgi:hypothetical protein